MNEDESTRAALLRRGFAPGIPHAGLERGRTSGAGRYRNHGRFGGPGRFGLDSLIEIGASTVVIWDLSGTGGSRQHTALRLIGIAFGLLAVYLAVQSTVVLIIGDHPRHSPAGIRWTALTAAVMFTLAAGKARAGAALDNPVLRTEGRVTLIDGLLATAVLAGLLLNTLLNWRWADPLAGYVLVFYAGRELQTTVRGQH